MQLHLLFHRPGSPQGAPGAGLGAGPETLGPVLVPGEAWAGGWAPGGACRACCRGGRVSSRGDPAPGRALWWQGHWENPGPSLVGWQGCVGSHPGLCLWAICMVCPLEFGLTSCIAQHLPERLLLSLAKGLSRRMAVAPPTPCGGSNLAPPQGRAIFLCSQCSLSFRAWPPSTVSVCLPVTSSPREALGRD